MSDLLSIGRFSEATGLTTKALRLYDRLGILRPAVVELGSGYRYYRPDQIAIAAGIQSLRALHMSLDDIAALLRAKDRDAIQSYLDRHREWIEGRIAEYQEALRRLPTADEWCISTGKDGMMTQETKSYQCSFCGKDNKDVRRVIAGPGGVAICNECVQECNELIAEYDAKAEGA